MEILVSKKEVVAMKKLRVLTVLVVCLLAVSLAHAGKLPNPKKVPFEEAVPMLNTPQLVQSWLYRYFIYDVSKAKRLGKKYKKARTDEAWTAKEGQMWQEDLAYPSETYYDKKGVCFDAANFAAYCLYKAGYEVAVLSAKYKRFSRRGTCTHSVCAFKSKKNGKWYIVADTPMKNTDIDGPFSSLQEAAEGIKDPNRRGFDYYFLGRKKFEGDTKFAGIQINGEKLVLSGDR